MYYHIVLGNQFSTLLSNYILDANLQDEHQTLTLLDDLSFGPLRHEALPFTALRNQYWSKLNNVATTDGKSLEIDDLERLLALRNQMVADEAVKLVFWVYHSANNLVYYYLIIHYFKHFHDRLLTINTTGLPFLNEQLRLCYPAHLYQIPPKELRKVLKLIRPLSKPEIEADADEFKMLQAEREKHYRLLLKGKTLHALSYNDFGEKLLDAIPNDRIKIKKMIALWMQDYDSCFAPSFYQYFIKDLAQKGIISVTDNTIIKS